MNILTLKQIALSMISCILAVTTNSVVASNHQTAQPEILVSIKPLKLIVDSLVRDQAKVSLLVDGVQSVHHISLKPSDLEKIDQANLILWVGPSLETPLDKAIKSLGKTSAQQIVSLRLPNMHLIHSSHSHQGHEEHQHDQNETYYVDPHIWLDPNNALAIAKATYQWLIKNHPNQAAYWQNNYDRFVMTTKKTLESLTALKLSLSDSNKQFWVYHDGFRYLEELLGKQHHQSVQQSENHSSSLKHRILLKQKAIKQPISCVLATPKNQQVASKVIQSIQLKYPLSIVLVDMLGSQFTSQKNTENYSLFILELAQAFRSCLQENG